MKNADIDRDGIIVGLTDGVGAAFGRAARRSFYEQFKRLETVSQFQKAKPEEQQLLVDLLALACFYQSVIVPVESTRSFLGVLRRAGAMHLRVAGDKLGARYASRAHAATIGFTKVLGTIKAPTRLLTYPTMKRFVVNALQFYRGIRDEPSVD
jgi:hypothetical protein